jgi:hypothetical protein
LSQFYDTPFSPLFSACRCAMKDSELQEAPETSNISVWICVLRGSIEIGFLHSI